MIIVSEPVVPLIPDHDPDAWQLSAQVDDHVRVIDELISTELAEEERVTEIFSTVVLVGVVDSSGVSMIGLFPPPPPQEIKKIKIKK